MADKDEKKDRPPEMDDVKAGLDALHRGDYEVAAAALRKAQETQKKDGRG